MAEGGGEDNRRHLARYSEDDDMEDDGFDGPGGRRMKHMMGSEDERMRSAMHSEPTESTQDKKDHLKKIDLRWATVEEIKRLNMFNADTIKYLEGLSSCVYEHQEVGQHITHFIEQEVQMDPVSYDPADRDCLKDDLSYLAFTEEMAGKIVERIPDGILTSQNSAYWALSFLDNWILSRNDKVDYDDGDSVKLYKYMRNIQDLWFEWKFDASAGVSGDGEGKAVRVYNQNEKPLRNDEFYDNHTQYFFHGTDWDSVDSIIKHGIFLRSGGCVGQEFSFRQRPGFYVWDRYDVARAWAEARAGRSAVIVFKVPSATFADAPAHLNLMNRDRDFRKKVYAYHLSGGDVDVGLEVETEIHGYKTIKGPLLLNPGEVRASTTAETLAVGVELNEQMCILDEQVASAFRDSIDKIIYFEKRELDPPDINE